jgi:hypothetical protein
LFLEREEAIVPEGSGKDGERLLIDDDADDVVVADGRNGTCRTENEGHGKCQSCCGMIYRYAMNILDFGK